MHLFSCPGMRNQLCYAVLCCVVAECLRSQTGFRFSLLVYCNLREVVLTWGCSSMAGPGSEKDEQNPPCHLKPWIMSGTIYFHHILLVKTCHMAKPKVSGTGMYTLPTGPHYGVPVVREWKTENNNPISHTIIQFSSFAFPFNTLINYLIGDQILQQETWDSEMRKQPGLAL